MKPNFALSLSFEGIRLLHRAAGGWRSVGDVALDAADMPGELAMLRRTATALEPGGLRTKLLLPAEQVKYLTIDTVGMDKDARMDAARAALDGATPYAVDDLAFDISADGDATHIAAVARETLAEAEAFAMEHRFHPTSFASVPADSPYLGEPFFGATEASVDLLAPGEQVEPDGIAVVVIGDVSEGVKKDAGEAIPPAEVTEEDAEEAATEGDSKTDESAPQVMTETNAPEQEEEEASPAEDADQLTDAADDTAKAKSAADAEDDGSEDNADTAEPKQDVSADTTEISVADAQDGETPGVPEKVTAAPEAASDVDAQEADVAARDAHQEENSDAKPLPVLPSLGAASRATPPSAAVPPAPDVPPATGFSSRRGADAVPARKEPLVSAPSLPAEAVIATESPTKAPVPPAPPAFTAAESTTVEPEPAAGSNKPAKAGFLSRRKVKGAPKAAVAVGAPVAPRSEAERMTIFGARKEIGGKPRFLGLMLTAALLVFLAGVAAWASVFLDEGLNLSRLFGERATPQVASAPAEPEVEAEAEADQVQTASLGPALTEEDTAVLDALREPGTPVVRDITPEQLEANYAITGIWPVAPLVPPDPAGLISIEDLYLTSIDPVSTANDAVALPDLDGFSTDVTLDKVPVPAAAGTVFALDDRGLVIPTVEGALSPDGFTVYAGRPELIPPPTPTRFQPLQPADTARDALGGFRPKTRPGDLTETNERANLDGLTRNELAGLRPQLRPRSVQQQAEAAAAAAAAAEETSTVDTSQAVADALAEPETTAFVAPTRLAVAASVRPDTRPGNFARIVSRAQRTPKPEAETRVASAGAVAPRTVAPKIPSKTSVAKQATVRNAINLRQVNLIGVYGKPSNRRALVRLANGRYKKVVVGDRIDGGRVSAIGDSELRYNKSGRNVVLKMPRG